MSAFLGNSDPSVSKNKYSGPSNSIGFNLYMDLFFQQIYWKKFWRLATVWRDIFYSLAYFIVKIQFIVHVTYKVSVNRLFKLLVRLPVNNSQLLSFWGVKVWTWVGPSKPRIVQGSTEMKNTCHSASILDFQ